MEMNAGKGGSTNPGGVTITAGRGGSSNPGGLTVNAGAGGVRISVPAPRPCPACGRETWDGEWVRHYLGTQLLGEVCARCWAEMPLKVAALERRVAELEAMLAPMAVVEEGRG